MCNGTEQMNGRMDCLGVTAEVKVGTAVPSFASEV